jgi:hypothetical protein
MTPKLFFLYKMRCRKCRSKKCMTYVDLCFFYLNERMCRQNSISLSGNHRKKCMRTNGYINIYLYTCKHGYLYIYTSIHGYLRACIYIYTQLYTHIYMDMLINYKYIYMCICMVWIYHTFSDSYVYEIFGMQSENPTLEETGKASSRHSWFKCLQARQNIILG